MAVAYSNRPIIVAAINGENSATMRSDLDAALRAAGWVSEAIDDGHEYTLTSPQSTEDGQLQAKCRIRDLGATDSSANCITVQFLSYDGARLGKEHTLAYATGRSYEIIAGVCQMFVALPDHGSTSPGPDSAYSTCVAGGVPFIRQECDADAPVDVMEAWWSSGDGVVAFPPPVSFRSAWYHGDETNWSACFEGDLIVAPGGGTGAANRLGLRAIAHPAFDFPIYQSYQKTQWMDETPLYCDPLILWGSGVNPSSGLARVRGQLWDAVLGSKDAPLNDEITSVETVGGGPVSLTWRNWMHYEGDMGFGSPFTYYASLYLLVTPPGRPENIAY